MTSEHAERWDVSTVCTEKSAEIILSEINSDFDIKLDKTSRGIFILFEFNYMSDFELVLIVFIVDTAMIRTELITVWNKMASLPANPD